MISYLYTFDYDENGKGGQSTAGFSNVRVYAIAEKYNIPLLKEVAKEKFVKWAENHWSHCDFPVVAREVYESTPSSDIGLRDVVSRVCGEHVKELVGKKKFLDLTDLFGELGLGILVQVLKDKEEMEEANSKMKRAQATLATELNSQRSRSIELSRQLNEATESLASYKRRESLLPRR
jgi:hypothetical protein